MLYLMFPTTWSGHEANKETIPGLNIIYLNLYSPCATLLGLDTTSNTIKSKHETTTKQPRDNHEATTRQT